MDGNGKQTDMCQLSQILHQHQHFSLIYQLQAVDVTRVCAKEKHVHAEFKHKIPDPFEHTPKEAKEMAGW